MPRIVKDFYKWLVPKLVWVIAAILGLFGYFLKEGQSRTHETLDAVVQKQTELELLARINAIQIGYLTSQPKEEGSHVKPEAMTKSNPKIISN